MPVVDQANGTGLACTALNAAQHVGGERQGRAHRSRDLHLPEKVKNAQNAGAIGVIIVDNVAGSPPPGWAAPIRRSPSRPCASRLPTARLFKNALRTRSRTRSGVLVTMLLNLATYAGADAAGRALIFTPNPFQGGSSVSHWDTIHTPNQLMEPAINGDLTHSVTLPQDLTFALLRDIGWNP